MQIYTDTPTPTPTPTATATATPTWLVAGFHDDLEPRIVMTGVNRVEAGVTVLDEGGTATATFVGDALVAYLAGDVAGNSYANVCVDGLCNTVALSVNVEPYAIAGMVYGTHEVEIFARGGEMSIDGLQVYDTSTSAFGMYPTPAPTVTPPAWLIVGTIEAATPEDSIVYVYEQRITAGDTMVFIALLFVAALIVLNMVASRWGNKNATG